MLSRQDWVARAFDQTTLDIPLGSGPYRIKNPEAGRYIVLYRNSTVSLEAFKGGAYGYCLEIVLRCGLLAMIFQRW